MIWLDLVVIDTNPPKHDRDMARMKLFLREVRFVDSIPEFGLAFSQAMPADPALAKIVKSCAFALLPRYECVAAANTSNANDA
jgi:hypothetical protein